MSDLTDEHIMRLCLLAKEQAKRRRPVLMEPSDLLDLLSEIRRRRGTGSIEDDCPVCHSRPCDGGLHG